MQKQFDTLESMIDIGKFYADVQRALKHYRASTNNYDGIMASEAVAKVFVATNRDIEQLMQSFVELWLTHYIKPSTNLQAEPSAEHIDWLANLLMLIDGDGDAKLLPHEDLVEIGQIVNSEAEDIPLEILSAIMTRLVDCHAL